MPRRLARLPGAATVDEIVRLWRARHMAGAALDRHRPAAVVVIQDTLLLERFLVREANRAASRRWWCSGRSATPRRCTTDPRGFQYGNGAPANRGLPRRVLDPSRAWRLPRTLRALGLSFDLANSYGGGEARLFAVMGEAFRDQFVAQGVTSKRIVVSGHPTHDTVFRRAQTLDAGRRGPTSVRATASTQDRTIVLYATQPVLWRKVMTRETLERNVRAMAEAVHRQPGCELVLKLHPREDPADYAFCATLDPPVRVITQAEMPELIAACDLFVSSSSSTVLLAMMLDRPIITVNFDEVPHFDQFEPIGGTLHVRTHDAFADAFERAAGRRATARPTSLGSGPT